MLYSMNFFNFLFVSFFFFFAPGIFVVRKLSSFKKVVDVLTFSFIFNSLLAMFLLFFESYSKEVHFSIVLFISFFLFFYNLRRGFRYEWFTFRKKEIFLVLILMVFSILFYVNSSQELSGRHDIGVYVSSSYNIFSHGSQRHLNSSLKSFYEVLNPERFLLFPDFILTEEGFVTSIQPPLFVAFLSNFIVDESSLPWLFHANLIVAVLSLLVFYFLLVSLIKSERWALILTICYGLNYIFIFFSQYTSPELFFQLGILLICYQLTKINFNKTCEGQESILLNIFFLIFIMFFIKVEAILLLILLLYLFLFISLNSKLKGRVFFLLVSCILFLFVFLYYQKFLLPYLNQLERAFISAYGIPFSTLLVLLFIFSFILFFISFVLIKRKLFCTIVRKMSFLLFSGWSLFLFLTSPYLDRPVFSFYRGSVEPVIVLSNYIPLFFICFALFSFFIIFIKMKSPFSLEVCLGFLFLPYFLFYLTTIPNNVAFPWMLRRHIIAVIPGIYLFSSFFFQRRVMSSALKYFTFFIILFISIIYSANLTSHSYEGMIDLSEALARELKNCTVLDLNWYSDGLFSLPLRYIYNVDAFLLSESELNESTLDLFESTYGGQKCFAILSVSQSRLNRLLGSKKDFFHFVKSYELDYSKLNWGSMSHNKEKYHLSLQLYVFNSTTMS